MKSTVADFFNIRETISICFFFNISETMAGLCDCQWIRLSYRLQISLLILNTFCELIKKHQKPIVFC